MARQRIHKLAAEWGVKSKDVIERLEKMGVSGKKAQSVLDETTADRVRVEMGLGVLTPTVGLATVVSQSLVERRGPGEGHDVTVLRTVTETRVKTGVVLRHTQKREVVDESGSGEWRLTGSGAGMSGPTAVSVSPADLLAFDSTPFLAASVPATLAMESMVPEHEYIAPVVDVSGNGHAASTADETATAETVEGTSDDTLEDEHGGKPPIAGADEIAEELLVAAEAKEAEDKAKHEAETKAAAEVEAATPTEAAKRPGAPRILGRIDLKKQAQPVLPGKSATGDKDKKEGEGEQAAAKPTHKKRRKVVQKEDLFDALERSYQSRPRKKRAAPGQKIKKTEVTTPKASKRVVKINEITSAGGLAKSMGVKSGEILGALIKLGVMQSINDPLDLDTATLVAEEFGYTIEDTSVHVDELLDEYEEAEEDSGTAEPRPPVVTVMGHVDHGKTSLLDVIRRENVVAGEAGGITQHIGAYNVSTPHGDICFIDTPGHAAFTAMRARGAGVTDLVVLVVAADDGVMPQTLEAISHAQAAGNPIIVAITKVDKPDANPDRVKQQLAERGLQTEDWGGQTQCVLVSAVKKTGIDELLEQINVLAQVMELKAVKDRHASGTVIEAQLDRGRGPVATILVQHGTLHRGETFVCGATMGKIRAMTDHAGKTLQVASPSTPVEITGLESVPAAGDSFVVVPDAARAVRVAEIRLEAARKEQLASSTRMSLEDWQKQVAMGETSELKLIIKTDVQGTAEALQQALAKLSTTEVAVDVIHNAVGAVSESDVQLALASDAMIVGFQVRPEAKARALAEREGVEVRLHTVIYEVVDEIRAALEGMLTPDVEEKLLGRAEVRDTFSVPGGLTIAGSYMTEGQIQRGAKCRLLRDNVVITTSSVGSLRRFKDDVREVQAGYECGIGIERFNDIKVGDIIECFRMEEIKRTLEQSAARAAASE